ncbi:hypothetical protein AB0D59_23640 [Streptomyces sp. NPDC048417]|uniref:hypothetical protein n=1 Tax=Streptomyces sp. NPDC048417 TaxID=3155387 RepID=UPI003436874D
MLTRPHLRTLWRHAVAACAPAVLAATALAFLRHVDGGLWPARLGGPHDGDSPASFRADTAWAVAAP